MAQNVKPWIAEFLSALEDCGMVTEACRRSGVSRTAAYRLRQADEDFALAWHEVEERAIERMEREAYRRAVEGIEKPLVSAGKMVTTCTEYSDGLMTTLLKAHRPEKYRDNFKVEHSGKVETLSSAIIFDGELARDARELLRRAATPSSD